MMAYVFTFTRLISRDGRSGDLDYVVMAVEGDVMIPLDTICILSAKARKPHRISGVSRFIEPIANIQTDQITN